MTQNQSLTRIAISLCDYPDQPRTHVEPDYISKLAENLKCHGQQVPVIGYFQGERFQLEDGGCRLRAAALAGFSELSALDLGKKPSRSELLIAQISIDQHRQTLPPMDRARLFRAILEENRWTSRQLSEAIGVSEAVVSRCLAMFNLPETLQLQLNTGLLDPTKAYLISQEKDPAKQIELATLASGLSRESFTTAVRKTQRERGPDRRLCRVACPLASGVTITLAGERLSLDEVIEALAEAQKHARKASDQGWDAKTFQAVMKDKAKLGSS